MQAENKRDKYYPLETVVRIKKTGQFAIIKERVFLMENNFLYYLGIIEGRGEGLYYLGPNEIDLEVLPL
jgi:hypothetical protein